jgi:hypothetical protein
LQAILEVGEIFLVNGGKDFFFINLDDAEKHTQAEKQFTPLFRGKRMAQDIENVRETVCRDISFKTLIGSQGENFSASAIYGSRRMR